MLALERKKYIVLALGVIFKNIYLDVHVYAYFYEFLCSTSMLMSKKHKDGVRFPKTGITGGCRLPDVGLRTKTGSSPRSVIS